MTEQQKRLRLCSSWLRCNASVCPLYDQLEHTYHIQGDSRCTKILDYLEASLEDGDLKEEIRKTEPVWRKVLGEKLLAQWVEGRNKVRDYFRKAG